MKYRKRIPLALLALVIPGLIAWWALLPREPVYQGKTLTQWLGQGVSNPRAVYFPAPIINAVTNIGTNALPFLLKKIQTTDSPLKSKFINLVEKQSVVEVHFIPAWISRSEAVEGYSILGPLAKSAVPKLSELLTQDESGSAAFALAGIGFDGAMPLVQALTNKNENVRNRAVMALGAMGSTRFIANMPPEKVAILPEVGKIAVRPLLECLKDRDEYIRAGAVRALGAFGCEPEIVVPALINQLTATNADPEVVHSAVRALENFGPRAKASVPALLQTLNHPDSSIRFGATEALKAIDPNATAQTGVK
jgi:HEAT repeat protein